MENKIKLFEDRRIRYAWDAEREEWFFSAVDVCYALSESAGKDPGAYWRKLKQRLKSEGSEVVTNCHGLKLLAEVTTTAISKSRKPDTFIESKAIAQEGGDVAKDARLNIEKRTGKNVISSANAMDKLQLDIKSED